MKNKNIIHRNLKPSNILLSLNKLKINKICFKISDFGLSKLIEGSKMNKMSLNGTPITMAPEILKGEENLISYKSDIWSLGIIIYYMLFKEYPYNGNEYQIIKEIESKKQLKIINNKQLDDLIKQMLVQNINERITWEKYLEHPFFQISNGLNIPIFNFKCNIHSEDLIGYCTDCKSNICLKCYQEHSLKSHQVILFFEIGFSEDEIKQINDLTYQIENNIQNFKKIKEEIDKFINDIKSIKETKLYNNDNKNNFKNYTIEYLKIMNDKLKINEKINLPVFPKWEYRYNIF
jgi:serine/threonine protein kinase